MRWFNDLPFRFKLSLPLGVMVLILLLLAGVSINQSMRLADSNRLLTGTLLPQIETLVSTNRDLYRALSAERSLLFLNVRDEKFEAAKMVHRASVEQSEERLREVLALVSDESQKGNLESILEAHKNWVSLTDEVVSNRAENTRQGRSIAIKLSFGEASQTFGELIEQVEVFVERASAAVKQSGLEADSLVLEVQYKIVGVAILGVIVCAFVVLGFPGMVTRPINEMINYTNEISRGQGDLSRQLNVKSKDELGMLSDGFNKFMVNLRVIISEVKSVTKLTHGKMEEAKRLGDQSNHAIEQQKIQVELVAHSMLEMSESIHEVAESAEETRLSAEKAHAIAVSGQKVVDQTVSIVGELAEEVVNASEVITQLQDAIGNIGSVLSVIRGIADQTNLLALNAAIEAARAGEQGRGFAVVADEVRALASRTQESTGEIQNMIEALESRAAKATEVMASGREKADASVDKSSKMNVVLTDISEAVDKIHMMTAQIASATTEQSSVSDEVSRAIVVVSDLANETAEASSKGGESLAGMVLGVDGLAALVQKFKT
ncbi:MAG: hypothetical protein COA99_11520 [Moraxellaceae bacterium]|nr:MAG: hypothetical protein COA99_11520 [Moraxellaceae bacterium]